MADCRVDTYNGYFIGNVKGSTPDGYGEYYFDLGSKFLGLFRKWYVDGVGVYFWADGRADVGIFRGRLDDLPIMAHIGDGVRWSKDRTYACLLHNGIEICELTNEVAEKNTNRFDVQIPEEWVIIFPPAKMDYFLFNGNVPKKLQGVKTFAEFSRLLDAG